MVDYEASELEQVITKLGGKYSAIKEDLIAVCQKHQIAIVARGKRPSISVYDISTPEKDLSLLEKDILPLIFDFFGVDSKEMK